VRIAPTAPILVVQIAMVLLFAVAIAAVRRAREHAYWTGVTIGRA
jgi:hypothetical protein